MAWMLLIAVAVFVYYPGLDGPFLFDDYANLSSIGLYGGISDWYTLQQYVFGGIAGPTGRPLSLASFLLNATDWPADAFYFKATNLLIHLICATLVFANSKKILEISTTGNKEPRAQLTLAWVSLVSASIWLLHPYLTSTTLYVVQRMASLSALFCFLGLWLYLHGRSKLVERPDSAYIWMSAGVIVGTVLATFSKENGAVLPFLILILESTAFSNRSMANVYFRRWKFLFLVVPTVGLVGYLSYRVSNNGFFENYAIRDYSPFERLLTQSRVIFSYLESWFVPSFSGGEIFYDDIRISRSINEPITTIFSVLSFFILCIVSMVFRKKYPLLAFSFLFFLGSQLIESTTINLEMKFDHRIYLGSAFLALPLVFGIAGHTSKLVRQALVVVALLLLSAATYSSATLWGSYEKLTLVWATKSPLSARAQTEAAKMLYDKGNVEESLALLDRAANNLPQNFRLHLTRAIVQCKTVGAGKDVLELVYQISLTESYQHTDFGLLQGFYNVASDKSCSRLDLRYFKSVVDRLIQGSTNPDPNAQLFSQLYYFKGLSELRLGDMKQGLQSLKHAESIRFSLHMKMTIAANKAAVGLYVEALEDAYFVKQELESGDVTGRDRIEAPRLKDVHHFISVVENDLKETANKSD